MAGQIPIPPPVNSLPLHPAKGGFVLNVKGNFGVVGQLIGIVLAKTKFILVINQILVPEHPFRLPVLIPLLHLLRVNKPLNIPLLKLPQPVKKVLRINLVAERLTNLSDSKGNLQRGRIQNILVVKVNCLTSFPPEVYPLFFPLDHT